jgi:predicted Zn-dependent protease
MNLIIFNRALRKCITLAFAGALFLASSATSNELKLPNLGESSTSLFSADFEHQLGRTWLRAFRSQVRTIDDPVLQGYLENLIYNLATHSQLEDRRIEVIIVDNPTINAFAVPGGIIGIHNGLLLYAQTEDELATVLAHELGHLSQRHFSRSVEYQKSMGPLAWTHMLRRLCSSGCYRPRATPAATEYPSSCALTPCRKIELPTRATALASTLKQ